MNGHTIEFTSGTIDVTPDVIAGTSHVDVYGTEAQAGLVVGSLFAMSGLDPSDVQQLGQPLVFPFMIDMSAGWVTSPDVVTWVVPGLFTAPPSFYWESTAESRVALVFGVGTGDVWDIGDRAALHQLFDELAARWSRETEFTSVHAIAVRHPAYQQIIEMGQVALPWLLERLRDHPDHWMLALSTIANEDPASNAATFGEARELWLAWGREHALIS